MARDGSHPATTLAVCWLATVCATAALTAAPTTKAAAPAKAPAAGKVVHPALVYQPADRAKILNRLKAGADKNSPDYTLSMMGWWQGTRFETHILPAYKYEWPRADAVRKLAIVTWLTPDARVNPTPA
jgi:hypothetical protein